jgi:hypothetical protein
MTESSTIFRVDQGVSAGLGVPRLDLTYPPLPPAEPALILDWYAEVGRQRSRVDALTLLVDELYDQILLLKQPWWKKLYLWARSLVGYGR